MIPLNINDKPIMTANFKWLRYVSLLSLRCFVAFSFIMLFGLADGMLDLGKTDRLVTKDSTSKAKKK